jgi:hypothetical protein
MLFFFMKNPFASAKISLSNFDKLVKAHLASLQADNRNDSLTLVYNDTLVLYAEFSSQIAQKSSSSSLRKGQTENAENMSEIVKDFIAEQEPNIQYQFRKEPGKYAEFFPNGLTEYRRAGKDDLVNLFNRFVTTCEPYSDRLGTDVIAEARQLNDQWKEVRDSQVQKKEKVKNLSGAAATSQQALAIRLYRTLGLLISLHAEQPDAINKFFDFSFLPKSTAKKIKTLSEAPGA